MFCKRYNSNDPLTFYGSIQPDFHVRRDPACYPIPSLLQEYEPTVKDITYENPKEQKIARNLMQIQMLSEMHLLE